MKQVMILGSTGSVGNQALDIIKRNPEQFKLTGLSTNKNIQLLVKQIQEFKPRYVAITDEDARREFVKIKPPFVQVISIDELSSIKTDIYLNAMVGLSGLKPSINILKNGCILGMANKEPIVSAGRFLMDCCKKNNAKIIPVDSEHSAIWQCLKAGQHNEIKRLILTASGGPFKDYTLEQLATVTPQLAMRHPVWKMGQKVTIDSATLMNKGFEVIEAMNLFDVPLEKVDVIIHPESVVHSMVEYIDNTLIACMSYPDMRLPVQLALSYPDRIESGIPSLDLTRIGTMHFERPNLSKFRCLSLALEATKLGEASVIALSAADEVVVPAFLEGRISFNDIPRYLEMALGFVRAGRLSSVDEVISIDVTVKKYIRSMLKY
ncbi:MAG: 1-deoxy-D-xylulose-5-phosphate reductoisomerase [Clostridia bacterium]